MGNQELVIAIACVIVVSALIYYVYLTFRKDKPEDPSEEFVPEVTHDPNSSFLNTLTCDYTITLSNGNQMTWGVLLNESAYDSLKKAFGVDRDMGILRFSEDEVTLFLIKCEHLDSNGWPIWDSKYPIAGLAAMANVFTATKPAPDNDLINAKFIPTGDTKVNVVIGKAKEAPTSPVIPDAESPAGVKLSTCCKVPLKKGHQKAKRCSKCNRFSKAI